MDEMIELKALRPRPAPRTTDGIATLVAVGLLAVCCGAPFLIAALAATGIGAWLYAHGAALFGAAAVLSGAGLVFRWLKRSRRVAPSGRDLDCCATGKAREREKT